MQAVGVGATGNLIAIADPIVVGIVVCDRSCAIGLSRARVAGIDLEDAERIVGVGGGGGVVIAGQGVGATCDFIVITDPIIVFVVVDHRPSSIGLSRAGVTPRGDQAQGVVGVGGGGGVVVAGRRVGAAGDLIVIADAVIVVVVVYHGSRSIGLSRAGVAGVDFEDAERVVGVGGGGGVVVAGQWVGAPCDFVVIADAIVVFVIVDDRSTAVGFSGAGVAGVDLECAEGVVGVGGGRGVVVAGQGVGAPDHFVVIANAIVVVVVVNHGSAAIGFSRAGVAGVDLEYAEGVIGVGGGGGVVVAGDGVGASLDFVVIADTIVVGIVVDDGSAAVGFSRARVAGVDLEYAEGVIGVGAGGGVVIAGQGVGAPCDFVVIADAIVIGVIFDHGSAAIGFSTAAASEAAAAAAVFAKSGHAGGRLRAV